MKITNTAYLKDNHSYYPTMVAFPVDADLETDLSPNSLKLQLLYPESEVCSTLPELLYSPLSLCQGVSDKLKCKLKDRALSQLDGVSSYIFTTITHLPASQRAWLLSLVFFRKQYIHSDNTSHSHVKSLESILFMTTFNDSEFCWSLGLVLK